MDIFKLEYEMKKRNVTVDELCAAIGMSKSVWYRRIKNPFDFTQGEIEKIVEFLGLGSPMGIFFAI